MQRDASYTCKAQRANAHIRGRERFNIRPFPFQRDRRMNCTDTPWQRPLESRHCGVYTSDNSGCADSHVPLLVVPTDHRDRQILAGLLHRRNSLSYDPQLPLCDVPDHLPKIKESHVCLSLSLTSLPKPDPIVKHFLLLLLLLRHSSNQSVHSSRISRNLELVHKTSNQLLHTCRVRRSFVSSTC